MAVEVSKDMVEEIVTTVEEYESDKYLLRIVEEYKIGIREEREIDEKEIKEKWNKNKRKRKRVKIKSELRPRTKETEEKVRNRRKLIPLRRINTKREKEVTNVTVQKKESDKREKSVKGILVGKGIKSGRIEKKKDRQKIREENEKNRKKQSQSMVEWLRKDWEKEEKR